MTFSRFRDAGTCLHPIGVKIKANNLQQQQQQQQGEEQGTNQKLQPVTTYLLPARGWKQKLQAPAPPKTTSQQVFVPVVSSGSGSSTSASVCGSTRASGNSTDGRGGTSSASGASEKR